MANVFKCWILISKLILKKFQNFQIKLHIFWFSIGKYFVSRGNFSDTLILNIQNSIDLLIIDFHPTWYIKLIIPNLGFLWATDNLPTNTKLICCMLSIQTNWSTLNSTKWRVIMIIGVIHTTPAKTFKALSVRWPRKVKYGV